MTLGSTAIPAVAPLASGTIIDAAWVDYLILAIYFVFVLGIGWVAKRGVSDSVDYFQSGRALPAWVTGLAFISANLGAVEIMGMSANGAEFGLPAVHYFWVGAIPAMLFLGVVMMPFYYGSKVRSVPEFMLRRFGPGAHLVNAISFAVAQLLIAGVNLFLLGTIVRALLGWPLIVALLVAAVVVLSYITLGGLSAAIYNEVLQFFVIVAALLPLTVIGLHQVGGWDGLMDRVAPAQDASGAVTIPVEQQTESWPGQALSGFDSPVLSVIGIVFGIVAMVWPLSTTVALVVLWGIWALVDGIGTLVVAGAAPTTGAKVLYGVLGLVSVAAAGLAFFRPTETVTVLTWFLGIWLLVRGAFEVLAIVLGRREGMVALGLVGAALSIAIGILFAANPGAAALSIAWLLGLLALLWGVVFVVAALVARKVANRLDEDGITVEVTEW